MSNVDHGGRVHTDLDTLVIALYVTIDETLQAHPSLRPWRPAVGIAPKLSDAELLTLAVAQALLGYVSEARWLRPAVQVGGGQARRRLVAGQWGGAAVVVRAWESRVHGEGRQQARSGRTGRPGGRR